MNLDKWNKLLSITIPLFWVLLTALMAIVFGLIIYGEG